MRSSECGVRSLKANAGFRRLGMDNVDDVDRHRGQSKGPDMLKHGHQTGSAPRFCRFPSDNVGCRVERTQRTQGTQIMVLMVPATDVGLDRFPTYCHLLPLGTAVLGIFFSESPWGHLEKRYRGATPAGPSGLAKRGPQSCDKVLESG